VTRPPRWRCSAGSDEHPLAVLEDIIDNSRVAPGIEALLRAEADSQPPALGPLAAAGGREQQQPHRALRSAGRTISRLRILPVGPLGSASTIHTLRGYL
jgi:hypothetical protein